jgi:hypothetical protein
MNYSNIKESCDKEGDTSCCYDVKATIKKIKEKYAEDSFYYNDFDAIFFDDIIVYTYYERLASISFKYDKNPRNLKDCLVLEDEKKNTFNICLRNDNGSFLNYEKEIDDFKFNADNYNDDFPKDKINDILKDKEKSGILIFHGEPGTGKTTFIKSLICENQNIDFIYLDESAFAYMNTSNFVKYLMDKEIGTVFILEDCETLLTQRIKNNTLLSNLLNLSDGLIGSGTGFKYICTFNTDLSNIDPAVMRRGRLRLIYEFKKLESEKVKKLGMCGEMTIGDIYNNEETGKKEKKAIGF